MQHFISGSAGLRALCFAAACACGVTAAKTQTPAAAPTQAANRASGTVKEVHTQDFLLTTASGDVMVTVPQASKVLIVPPGSTSLSSATPGAMTDIQPGDRALVTGAAGASASAFNATRVVVMKSNAIAAVRAAESSAWAQGSGGIVKSVSGTDIMLSSGMKTITVQTTPSTIVRRYAPGSVNFADATASTVPAIQPGDQLRVRGAKSADGSSVTADEIVSGNFKNYSGTIASIDTAGATITLKDLTTKRTVTVAITPSSDVRRLPAEMATMVAARMRGGQAGAGQGSAAQGGGPGGAPAGTARSPVSEAGGQGGRPGSGEAGGAGGPGSYGGPGGGRPGGAGADLSRMLARLPTETLSGLKQGDAVMIVATAGSPAAGDKATAITLLAGVESILAAPAGQTAQLSPWNMGGGGEGEMGGGGPQ